MSLKVLNSFVSDFGAKCTPQTTCCLILHKLVTDERHVVWFPAKLRMKNDILFGYRQS